MSNQNVEINFNPDRIYRNLNKAQKWLDSTVMTDTEEFLPMRQGILRDTSKTTTVYGSGEVIYGGTGVNYARYLFYGKVMVGKAPKKVTDKDIVYATGEGHPNSQAKWFEASKKKNLDHWIDGVKKIIGRDC